MILVEVDRWVAEGMLQLAIPEIKRLRDEASKFEGFIDGYLLQRIDDPHHIESTSTWRSKGDWLKWRNSEIRHDITVRVAPMLDEPETLRVSTPINM